MRSDSDGSSVLTINGGSSSIKFALFRIGARLERWFNGSIERIGQPGATLRFHDSDRHRHGRSNMENTDHLSAAHNLIDWFGEHVSFDSISAVGHRIVHGMHHTEPMLVSTELLDELYRISPYDLDHLPKEIGIIEAFRQRCPDLPQVACFDTSFHSTMPRVARLLPIPRRFDLLGVQRYGFHGLSYAFLMEELARVAGESEAKGRVVLAHLGNGASLAAVLDGKSIDTSMGFTPAGGVPMGTRTGDLDPGVTWHMMSSESLTLKQFNHLINHESGLLGVSETSADMRDLLDLQLSDPRAAEAVELFCYQVRKWIGSFAAALAGLDTLVFAGGIGENSAEVRTRICAGLRFLGIELDEAQNALHRAVISTDTSRIHVRVIRTDEEQMIASNVCRLLELPKE